MDGNHQDTGPLAGWSIVIVAGKTLLGRVRTIPGSEHPGGLRIHDLDRLEPAYELISAMQMVQQSPRHPPELMTIRNIQPLLTFPSLRSVDLPMGALFIPIEQLSMKERREMSGGVDACESLMSAMRAQESGIVLPPPGIRVKQP